MKHYLLACLLLVSISASATHFSGAYLRYEYTGTPLQYTIELTLYKTCESGSIDLPSFIKVRAKSAYKSLDISKNLPIVSNDTLQPYCQGTTNSCMNITATYPGYIVAVYKDTIALPTASNDWRLVFSNSNRNFGIDNIQGASGQSYYIDAIIDSTSNNTSSLMPDNPPHILFANDTARIPLTASDADGDDIRYKLINPEFDQGMNIPYYNGYSVAAPFGAGGVCQIDGDNNLVLMSPSAGKFTLALQIGEYRNNKLVAYTVRDFVIICIGAQTGNNGLSIPKAVDKDKFNTFTCPGKNNTLNLSYVDPAPGDSVYVSISTPNLSGWTFNTSTTNGIGQGKSTINWTTPASLNPAVLKHFDFKVTVRDNACRQTGEATYIYTVETRYCRADSVWPGDANSDKIVDLYDPLAVALAYNDTGATRINASSNWSGQSCDPWPSSFLNNIDKKHSDCDGNGKTDTADLNIIALNYTKTHKKGGGRSSEKTTADPTLTFDHTGITPNPDSIVTLNITLGDAANTVQTIYGLAANIKIDGLALSAPPVITYNNSWLGNNTNTLSFTKDITNTSVDWAYSRTNKTNTNGNGILAQITFQIPATATDGQLVTLSYDKAKLIDKDGIEILNFGTMEDTFYVRKPSSIYNFNSTVSDIHLYPNPSNNNLYAELNSNKSGNIIITIHDIAGKSLSRKDAAVSVGKNTLPLQAGNLHPGVYIINISDSHGSVNYNLRWVKQ